MTEQCLVSFELVVVALGATLDAIFDPDTIKIIVVAVVILISFVISIVIRPLRHDYNHGKYYHHETSAGVEAPAQTGAAPVD